MDLYLPDRTYLAPSNATYNLLLCVQHPDTSLSWTSSGYLVGFKTSQLSPISLVLPPYSMATPSSTQAGYPGVCLDKEVEARVHGVVLLSTGG